MSSTIYPFGYYSSLPECPKCNSGGGRLNHVDGKPNWINSVMYYSNNDSLKFQCGSCRFKWFEHVAEHDSKSTVYDAEYRTIDQIIHRKPDIRLLDSIKKLASVFIKK